MNWFAKRRVGRAPEILIKKFSDFGSADGPVYAIPRPGPNSRTSGVETFAKYYPAENQIVFVGGEGNLFRSERSIVHTLCHEVNHWGQYLGIAPHRRLRLGKEATEMIERAADWGIEPRYALNVNYRSARAIEYPKIVSRRFVRILKGEGHK